MASSDSAGEISGFMSESEPPIVEFYCPTCQRAVLDPLVCGDCRALLCRICGTPLERIDDLGIG